MFFHAKILFNALIFFCILELVSTEYVSEKLAALSSGNFWISVGIFIALMFYFYQSSLKISRRASMTPIPVMFAASSFGLLYFIESVSQQNFFIVLSAIGYYFIQIALYRLRTYVKDQTAIGIISAGNVAVVFLMYAVAYGIYLNFAIPLWIFMIVATGAMVLVGFQYFWLINPNKKIVFNYSLVLGFVMAEITWVLNFWPFGYLTTSVIGLVFYFLFWDVIQRHFSKKLSKRRIVANMILLGVITAIVLSSTRWLPAV